MKGITCDQRRSIDTIGTAAPRVLVSDVTAILQETDAADHQGARDYQEADGGTGKQFYRRAAIEPRVPSTADGWTKSQPQPQCDQHPENLQRVVHRSCRQPE